MLRPMDSTHRRLPDGYEFTKVLGSGSFGEVILARHARLKRLAAIRLIPGEAVNGEDSISRFEHESKLLMRTESRAVLRVYDVIRSQGDVLLVMEYARGKTLADQLSTGPLPMGAVISVLADVAEALEVAAGRGVVHQDIKASNIFVNSNGRAKLGDFGLTRLAANPSGGPVALAPELESGTAEPDERSDAYSFAALAFQMLTGRRLTDEAEVVAPSLGRKDRLKPALVMPGFPKAAVAAVKSGMSKDPATRMLPAQLVRELADIPPEKWPAVAVSVPAEQMTNTGVTAAARAPKVKESKVKESKVKGTRAKSPASKAPRQKKLRSSGPGVRRARKTSKRRLVGVALLSVVVLAAGAFGARWLVDRQGPLTVKQLTVDIRPASAMVGCPGGTFTFTGSIVTRGGKGSLSYRWTRPNGTPEPIRTVTLGKGRHTTTTTLTFGASGAAVFRGEATLQVLTPDVSSASGRFTYSCTGG